LKIKEIDAKRGVVYGLRATFLMAKKWFYGRSVSRYLSTNKAILIIWPQRPWPPTVNDYFNLTLLKIITILSIK